MTKKTLGFITVVVCMTILAALLITHGYAGLGAILAFLLLASIKV